MRALILAAGRGSRMGAMTEDQPKCMTVLAGKSLLQWQIQAIENAGIESIALVTGYKAEKFEDLNIQKFHNENWSQSNMVSSLLLASDWFKQDSIISYSDIVYNHHIVQKLANCPDDICISYDSNWEKLWKLRFDNPLDDAESFVVDKNKYLVEIGSRARTIEEIQGQYMGLIKVTTKGFSTITDLVGQLSQEKVAKLQMTELLNLLLQKSVKIKAVETRGSWCEVDSNEDYNKYCKMLELESNWSHDWRQSKGQVS